MVGNLDRFFQRLEKVFGSFPMIGKKFLPQSRREAEPQRTGSAGVPRRGWKPHLRADNSARRKEETEMREGRERQTGQRGTRLREEGGSRAKKGAGRNGRGTELRLAAGAGVVAIWRHRKRAGNRALFPPHGELSKPSEYQHRQQIFSELLNDASLEIVPLFSSSFF